MRIFSTALICACLSSGTVLAQKYTEFGLRVGGNISSATFTGASQSNSIMGDLASSRSALAGYQLGVGAVFGSGHWALQPSLIYTQKGVKQKASASFDFGELITYELSTTSRVNYLELPINAVYSLGTDGQGLQIFAGPYVAFGVGGKVDYVSALSSSDPTSPNNERISASQKMAFGNTFAEFDPTNMVDTQVDARARRFDAGINVGIGYRRGPFQAQLGYGWGLLNVQPDYPASYQMPNDTGYHRTAQLTATYYFSLAGK